MRRLIRPLIDILRNRCGCLNMAGCDGFGLGCGDFGRIAGIFRELWGSVRLLLSFVKSDCADFGLFEEIMLYC